MEHKLTQQERGTGGEMMSHYVCCPSCSEETLDSDTLRCECGYGTPPTEAEVGEAWEEWWRSQFPHRLSIMMLVDKVVAFHLHMLKRGRGDATQVRTR